MSEKVYGAGALEATYQNLLLNPSFETVLFGAHTAAIKTHAVAGTTKNTQFPGWQGVAPAGSPSMDVDASTATFNAPGKQSMKVSAVTLGTASAALFVEQRWNATHYLDNFAAMCAGQIITAACDIKLVNPVASAFRIGISVDGGSNYTYSPYKANDTNWERLIVSLAGGSAPTDVRFRLSFEAGSTIEYYVDNIMVVAAPVALETLPFVPRLPIRLQTGTYASQTSICEWWTSNGGAGNLPSNHASLSKGWDPNVTRPHWSDRIYCMVYVGNGPASNAAYLYPNGGSASFDMYIAIQVTGVINGNQGICQFGADSLLRLARGHTDVYIAIFSPMYIGEGL